MIKNTGNNTTNTRIKKHRRADKATRFILANLASFSPKAKEYIIKQAKATKVFGLVERHEQQYNDSFWNNLTCKVSTCLAKKTSDKGSHGGETIAYKKHINAVKVPDYVWDTIKEMSPVKLCWTAIIITLNKKTNIVLCWVSECWRRIQYQ